MLQKYTINEGAFKPLTAETAYSLGFIAAAGGGDFTMDELRDRVREFLDFEDSQS